MKIYAILEIEPEPGCSSEDAVRGLAHELSSRLGGTTIQLERGKHLSIGTITVTDEPPPAKQAVGA